MKIVVIVIAVLVAVVLSALALAPWLVPAERMNQRIAAQLTHLTGRDIAFTGEPRLQLFPSAEIELRNVRIAGPGGFAAEPLAEIDEIRGQVSRLPLLLGRIEIDSFELVRPRVHLRVDAAGMVNWGLAPPESAAADQGRGQVALADTRIGRFTVRDGHVIYDNQAAGVATEVSAVEMELNWPSAGRAASAAGSAVWRDEPIEFNGTLAEPVTLVSGRPSSLRFALGSMPLKLSFDGTLSTLAGIQLDGEATATTPSVRRLIEWSGGEIGPGASLSAASIKGRAHLSGGSLDMADSVIEFDGNRGEGSLSLKHVAERPLVQGTLAFSTLDLTPYWEAFQAGLRSSGAWFTASIDLAPLKRTDVDLRLSSQRMVIGDTGLGDVAATLVANAGRVAVNIGRAKFLGGQLKASLNGEAHHGRVRVEARGSMTGLSAGAATAMLAESAPVEGTADLTVAVASTGGNWGELVGTLSGQLTLAVTNGELHGIDLPRLAAWVGSAPDDVTEPDWSGSTAFSQLQGTARLDGGLFVSDDLVMTGDGYVVQVSGSTSLAGGGLSGQGEIALQTPESRAVPFNLGGTWLAPVATLKQDQSMGPEVAEPG